MASEVARVQVQLDATVAKFESQIRRAEKTFSGSTDKIDRRASRTNQHLNNMGKGMDRAVRARVGNVGNQLQDVIVQAQMGTDAFRILGQQGPQLAGAFGPFGALLGVLIAGFATLAPFVLRSSDAAMDFKKTSEALDKVQKSLVDSQKDLTQSLDDLKAKYGESADAAQRLLIIASQLSLQKARDEFASLATTAAETLRKITTEEMGQLNSYVTSSAFDAALNRYTTRMRELADMFGVTIEQAMLLNEAMRNFANAKTLEEKADAAKLLSDRMDEFNVKVDRLPPVIRDALSEMTNVTLQFLEASKNADDLDKALKRGVDTTGQFTSEAARLKAEMNEAARAAERAFDMASSIYGLRFRDEEALMALPVKATVPPPKKTRRGGGGRSKKQEDKTAENLIKSMEDRLKKLQEENALLGMNEAARIRAAAAFDRERFETELNTAAAKENSTVTAEQVKQGKIFAKLVEEETLAIAAKQEAMRGLNDAVKDAADEQERLAENVAEVADRLLGAVQSADSFAAALKQVGFELLRMGAQGLFGQGPLGGALGNVLSSGIGSIFGGTTQTSAMIASANGNAFGRGNVIPFAKGGIVNGPMTFPMPKGMGMMGEAGPEAVMPLKRGPDGKLGVQSSGGGTTVVINAHYEPGVNAATRAMIAQENQKLKGEILDAVPGRASAGFRRNPGLRR